MLRQRQKVPVRHISGVDVLARSPLEVREDDPFDVSIIKFGVAADLRDQLVVYSIRNAAENPCSLAVTMDEIHEGKPSASPLGRDPSR
jgi:hypothetical protein